MTNEELSRRMHLSYHTVPIIAQFIPDHEKGQGAYFAMVRSESHTPGGLPVRSALTCYLKRLTKPPPGQSPSRTSPIEAIICSDNFQSMYSQALCSLACRDTVIWLGAPFALGFIKFIQNHWQSLTNDLRTGIPDPTIVTDPSVRMAVAQILVGPNPEIADIVEVECRKESWKGIVKRLWPKTRYISAIMTGAMAQYIPDIDYYSDGLPLVSAVYFATECHFGLNLNPLCKTSDVAYTLFPHLAYFEFEPVEKDDEEMKLVDLVDVQLGKEYEVVVTTYAGLYRYRVGDILRVSGFKNKSPQFNFVRRANVILNIHLDKTDEVDLRTAVTAAANHLRSHTNHSLVEYTSYADTSKLPGHYVLFWEISPDYCASTTGAKDDSASDLASVLEECCLVLEESLNSSYGECRVQDGSIGPLEIRVVKTDTFNELMNTLSQYKTPKCLKNPKLIELLNSRVVSVRFSPKCPNWTPAHKEWQAQ